MDNNPKMKKSTKYLLIGTLVLFLSVLGASIAYYLARVSGNLSGRAAGTELAIQVTKLSSNATGDLIPLDNDLETLQLAAAGYQDKGACVDINGYSVCQIYKITVTNNGSIDLKMNGTVTLSGQNTLAANNHNDYYVMVYINNLDEPQTDSGEFTGVVTFTTEDGRKVKGRFTKPFNLVERITKIYNDDTNKSEVENNSIKYNYATTTKLMKDRLGGTSGDKESGNIRYFGAEPNNWVDIGDKTEVAEERGNWLSAGAPFADETACNNWATSENITNEQIQQMTNNNYTTVSDFCSVSTVPAGTPILWRIIGVFDGKLRVVRDESIGGYSWDTSRINEWSQSDIMKLLNPGYDDNLDKDEEDNDITVNNSLYWNSGSGNCYTDVNNNTVACDFTNTGLSDEAKEYVVDQTVNLGGINWGTERESYSNQYYNLERGSTVIQNPSDGIARTLSWTGKVGLISPSDYGYATDFTKCTNTLYNYNSNECKTNDWLFSNYWYWTMSPDSSCAHCVWNVDSDGRVNYYHVHYNRGVRPVLTLSSGALAETGTGSKSDPYVLTS